MMRTRSGYGYAELAFDKDASLVDRSGYDELLDAVGRNEIDDVVVFAHGWNNNAADARLLYQRLAFEFRRVTDSDAGTRLGLAQRRLALLGVLWPSARYAEQDLPPGGATTAGPPVSDHTLWAHLMDLHDVFDTADANATLDAAASLVPGLDDSVQARTRFAALLRRLLPPPSEQDHDDLPDQLRRLPGDEVLRRLSAPVLPVDHTFICRPSGEAAALGLASVGFKAAAQRLLNLLTYYQMKARAVAIGTVVADVLRGLRERRDGIGVHLVGHSFGGRLVTAAAAAGNPGYPPLLPDSLTLLQAAYSHYGFASGYDGERHGFFRSVVVDERVRGPVLVTHSDRDLAVALAYPLASRLARKDSTAIGAASDRYGGLGRNGAQKTPEAVEASLLASGERYRFAGTAVYNLRSDHIIAGHNDIVRPEVAYAILSAVVARADTPSLADPPQVSPPSL